MVGCSKSVKAFRMKLPPGDKTPRAVTISQKCSEAVLISCSNTHRVPVYQMGQSQVPISQSPCHVQGCISCIPCLESDSAF